MRTALISDIHGNYAGLMAVLADIETQSCDRILCLGDLVDGGEDNDEVATYFRENGILTIQGNHDRNPNALLSPENHEYLQRLPETIVEGDVIYSHEVPRPRKRNRLDSIEAWNGIDDTDYSRIFLGHVHKPLIFGEESDEAATTTTYPIPYDDNLKLAANDRYVICVGAVGYSRDGWNRLRYAIYDDVLDTIQFRAPEGPILRF
jgi:predicted phosphodiesterase